MHESAADFTLAFRRLCAAAADATADVGRAPCSRTRPLTTAGPRGGARVSRDAREPEARAAAMRGVNPAFIPRNHRVERALAAAIDEGDLSPFAELMTVLSRPYEDQPAFADYANPPLAGERVLRTFCGT